MAINVNLAQLQTLNNTSILNQINSNNAIIETALTEALSLNGQTPNQMQTNLDMNSNQILNLPPPASANSPARLVDVTSPATISSVPPVGTSGAVVGLLNTANTWSALQTLPFTQVGTGAVQTTIDAKLKSSWINVFDFLTTAQITNVKSGSPTIDLSTAINNALAAMVTGTLYFPPGTYGLANPIVISTGQYLQGAGRGATIIRNIPGPATALIQTVSFATLMGTNSTGGPFRWGISDILFDGNRNNVTGTADVMDIYAYDYALNNVTIYNASAQGLFSQWSNSAVVPVATGSDGMEAHIYNLKIFNSAGLGLNFQGPHDSQFNQLLIIENGGSGAFFQTGANFSADGTCLNNFHSYGNVGTGLFISANEMNGCVIISESNTLDGVNVGTAGVGSLIATGVFTFLNGGNGTTLQGFRSVITNLVSRNNTVNGLNMAGQLNQVSNAEVYSNTNFGLALNGTNNTVLGITASSNTAGQYEIGGSGNSMINSVPAIGRQTPTPGVSPWTYTNGATPQVIYISASTNISQISISSTNLLSASLGANVPFTLELSPNESVIITYTGTLSIVTDSH